MQDEVEKPDHYQFGQMQAWDIIELAVMDIADPVTAYHVASALKYLLRAARKGGDTDIAKASAHLKRETARHITDAPDYDPASVAFRSADQPQADKARDALGKADAEYFALNYGFVPGDVHESRASISHGQPGDLDDLRSERSGPPTAPELAAADGASEYGNPVTPRCATPHTDCEWRTQSGMRGTFRVPWKLP